MALIIAYRLADSIGGKPAAVLTFMILLLYPIPTYFEGELLLDPVFTLFALISLYLIMIPKDGHIRIGWGSFFFGLASLTRPTILIFLPILVIYLWWSQKGPENKKKGILKLAQCLLIITLTIAPVTVINYLNSNQLILISYQGGVNFYIGNNPEANGLGSILPPVGKDWTLEDAAYLARQESGEKLRYASQSLFWYGKGFEYVLNHPGDFLKLLATKTYFLFSGHEISNNRPLDRAVFGNPMLTYLPIRFSWILALAVLPLFLNPAGRRKIIAIYGLILLYGLTVAMFFVTSRFRLPLVPLLAILAALGIVAFWNKIRYREIDRRLFFGVVCAIAVFVMATSAFSNRSLVDEDHALFLRGNQDLRQGNYTTAIARFDTLSGRVPYFKNSNLNLGIAYLKLGETDRAANAFHNEMKKSIKSAEAANNLGVIFLLKDELDSAFHYCSAALDAKPYYPEAAVNFLRVSKKISSSASQDSIERLRQRTRSLIGDNPVYLFEEALYMADKKRYAEAIDNQLRVIDLVDARQPSVSFGFSYGYNGSFDNENIRILACYQLGYLYGLTGDFETSINFSAKAIELSPDMKEAYLNLISGYRSIGDDRKADSVAAVYLSRWPG
jgi:tetratricopeptide (TPR) repeat protein